MIPIMEECEYDFLLLSKLLLTCFISCMVDLFFPIHHYVIEYEVYLLWIIYYNKKKIGKKKTIIFNTNETIQFHIGDKIIHLSIDGKHNHLVPMVQDFEATWLDWCHNLVFKYIINKESSQEYTHNFHHCPWRFLH